MDVGMEIGDLAMRSDSGHHARNDVVPVQHGPHDFQYGFLRKPGKLAQKFPVETKVQAEGLGHGENELAMRDWDTNIFGDIDGRDERPLLMALRADPAPIAGKADKHFMATIGTSNTCESFAQIPAPQVVMHGLADHRPPKAVPFLKTISVNLLEFIVVLFEQLIQWRLPRATRVIEFRILLLRAVHAAILPEV